MQTHALLDALAVGPRGVADRSPALRPGPVTARPSRQLWTRGQPPRWTSFKPAPTFPDSAIIGACTRVMRAPRCGPPYGSTSRLVSASSPKATILVRLSRRRSTTADVATLPTRRCPTFGGAPSNTLLALKSSSLVRMTKPPGKNDSANRAAGRRPIAARRSGRSRLVTVRHGQAGPARVGLAHVREPVCACRVATSEPSDLCTHPLALNVGHRRAQVGLDLVDRKPTLGRGADPGPENGELVEVGSPHACLRSHRWPPEEVRMGRLHAGRHAHAQAPAAHRARPRGGASV